MGLYNRFCKHFFAAVIIRLTAQSDSRAPEDKGNGCNTQRNKNTDGEKETTIKGNKRMRYTGTRSIAMG